MPHCILGQLLDFRNSGKLGDEVIKIAQAMLLCPLPYSATTENHITRTARLQPFTASGLVTTAISGGVLLPLVGGLKGDHFGIAAAFYPPSVAYLIVGVCAAILAVVGFPRAESASDGCDDCSMSGMRT